jgi:YidC/Oxa1 family membrane protein insertase
VMPLLLLEPLERPLTALLEWLHTTLDLSWAWAIVALTVIVRTVLLPLTVRQIHSMQRLQRHMPEMKAIQDRYKQDRAKQQEELLKFYRENKINPASSCLPILFQIPVFIALFFVLRDFEKEVFPEYERLGETRTDLGWLGILPDITEAASSHWSGFLLIAIYGISQTLSTLLMPATMDKTQRYILLALPLVFIPFVINFPSGLVLYWVTTNLWTVGQGLVTRQLRPAPVQPQKRSSRTPPGGDRARDAQPAKGAAPTASGQPRRVKKKKKRARR